MSRQHTAAFLDQREAILTQAAALFASRGFSDTSMNAVASACGMSKATLYHYVRDKSALLAQIALTHVERLEALVQRVLAEPHDPQVRLQQLILHFVAEYANARHAHRVLTEDMKFLSSTDRAKVVAGQRRVVDAFADTVAQLRPDLAKAGLHKAVTMLLFGMINWMFTWLRPDGAITHAQMAPIVSELFFGGLQAVVAQAAQPKQRERRSARVVLMNN